jgi:hypothetical protein
MPRFLLHHRHEPHECGVAFAAFRGHASPLRHRATLQTVGEARDRINGLVRHELRDLRKAIRRQRRRLGV